MTIHITMSADAAYAMPLAVSLSSIAHAHPRGSCQVAIVHDGIDARLRHRIVGDVSGHLDLEWIRPSPGSLEGMSNSAFLPPAALFRLMLPQLLDGVRRTVYVDSDVLVMASLADLADLDLQGLPAAAVRDAITPYAAGPLGTNWRELGLPADTAYFNSGVIAMDLVAFRDGALAERAGDLLRRRSLRWGDQCALNAVLAGLWLEVPRRWNVQTADFDGRALAWALWPKEVRAAVSDPALIHFTERDKPWDPGSTHPCREAWMTALDATAFAGWRPPPPPGRLRAAAGRFVRTVREALP